MHVVLVIFVVAIMRLIDKIKDEISSYINSFS